MKKLSKKLKRLRKITEGRKFPCRKDCSECCTHVHMSFEEKKRIDMFVRKNNIELHKHKDDTVCPYLSKEGKCQVYAERPIICRAFGHIDTPFLTCSYLREYASLPESKELLEYMLQIREEVDNGAKQTNTLWQKVMDGDFDTIFAVLSTYAQMRKSELFTEKQYQVTMQRFLQFVEEKSGLTVDEVMNEFQNRINNNS